VLSAPRQEALANYDREGFGTEEEGRSQVVTSEFADVIESIMPGLMRVFREQTLSPVWRVEQRRGDCTQR
jgi:hypothetical protein